MPRRVPIAQNQVEEPTVRAEKIESARNKTSSLCAAGAVLQRERQLPPYLCVRQGTVNNFSGKLGYVIAFAAIPFRRFLINIGVGI